MLLKDLKEHYCVSDFEKNKYLLYSKKGDDGKYMCRQFYCVVEKVGTTKFKIVPSKHFNGKLAMNTLLPTSDIKMLCACVDEYVKSLSFHSDAYCPTYRDNVFYIYACAEYLKGIGFENSKQYSRDGELYELVNKDVYGKPNTILLGIYGIDMLDDNPNDEVIVNIHNSDTHWVSLKCKKDIIDIIDTINSMLLPLFVGNSINQFKLANKLSSSMSSIDGLEQVSFNTNTFSIDKVNYKQLLIEKLENMLENLKK